MLPAEYPRRPLRPPDGVRHQGNASQELEVFARQPLAAATGRDEEQHYASAELVSYRSVVKNSSSSSMWNALASACCCAYPPPPGPNASASNGGAPWPWTNSTPAPVSRYPPGSAMSSNDPGMGV